AAMGAFRAGPFHASLVVGGPHAAVSFRSVLIPCEDENFTNGVARTVRTPTVVLVMNHDGLVVGAAFDGRDSDGHGAAKKLIGVELIRFRYDGIAQITNVTGHTQSP